MKLRLAAWGNAWIEYALDPDSGHHSCASLPEARKHDFPANGFASMEPVMGRSFRFYAVFAHDGRIYFQAGRKQWDLTNVSIETGYMCPFGLMSRFRLSLDGRTAHKVTLVHPNRAAWPFIDPTYDGIDFESDHFLGFLAKQLTDEEWREHVLSMQKRSDEIFWSGHITSGHRLRQT